ncbi:MAG: hypothetical protein MRY64_01150 [Hyphomonadaceae bacterium]|nr:hypothetical protein [Hyphomonadaceae bacterium]
MNAQPNPQLQAVAGTDLVRSAAPARPDLSGVTPAQRAAVIIAMLGEGAAKPIVEKLDDAALARVLGELENISYIPRDVLVEIVVDFLGHLRASTGALRAGPGRARELVTAVLNPNRVSAVMGDQQADPDDPQADVPMGGSDIWLQVQKREPRAVADYLARLSPNIISMILRKLDVAFTSDVLCHLDEQKLVPAMGYMVDAGKPEPAIESVIARMVQMEFLNAEQAVEEDDAAHLESIGELLSLIPDGRRKSVVDFLKAEHETKLTSIEKAILTIDALPDLLARNSVPVVFREMDAARTINILGILRATYPSVADFLLSNISSRMADQYRDDLEGFSPPPPDEAEMLLREFLSSIMDMKQRGLVTLDKPRTPEQ